MRSRLDNAYNEWKGTRYMLGGTNRRGIDCSAFMQVVFADYLGVVLPRTTREQMNVGASVRRRNIKIGDVVFFKTGRDTYHVGVMINSEQFLHASTSNGVTISNLQNQYWVNTYLTTRRML
jgi:cell wall-associated NlpC family hydrolase